MKTQSSIENLDGLIRKIREEGIAQARKEADALLEQARKQAEAIVEEAEGKARGMMEEARQASEKQMAAGRQALETAARDVLLEVRAALIGLLRRLLAEECRDQLSGEKLERFLEAVAVAWVERHGGESLDLWVPEAEVQRLLNTFLSSLQEKLKNGVEIRPHPSLNAGFHLARQGDTLHYDFSDRALAEVLTASLTPRFASLFAAWQKEEEKRS